MTSPPISPDFNFAAVLRPGAAIAHPDVRADLVRRVAAAPAKIGLTKARVGVIPGAGGTQRLLRLPGTARALDLMFSGEPIDADRAETIGFVQAAIPDEDLDARVLRRRWHPAHLAPPGRWVASSIGASNPARRGSRARTFGPRRPVCRRRLRRRACRTR